MGEWTLCASELTLPSHCPGRLRCCRLGAIRGSSCSRLWRRWCDGRCVELKCLWLTCSGSVAAAWHSTIGSVVAGSPFAILQSAGAGSVLGKAGAAFMAGAGAATGLNATGWF